MSNSGSASEKSSLKALLVKGLLSSVALVGTTAIPIVVQRSLQAPAGSAETVPVAPAQISPLPEGALVDSAATFPVINEDEKEEASNGKGPKKRDND